MVGAPEATSGFYVTFFFSVPFRFHYSIFRPNRCFPLLFFLCGLWDGCYLGLLDWMLYPPKQGYRETFMLAVAGRTDTSVELEEMT